MILEKWLPGLLMPLLFLLSAILHQWRDRTNGFLADKHAGFLHMKHNWDCRDPAAWEY